MLELKIDICGDYWCNRQYVEEVLQSLDCTTDLILDVGNEAPDLDRLGVLPLLRYYCSKGLDPNKIYINNWHNTLLPCEFTRLHNPKISHFFWMSDSYRPSCLIESSGEFLAGCFVGRPTLSRAVILHDLFTNFHNDVLLSLMNGSRQISPSLDTEGEWQVQKTFHDWWQNSPLTSIDDHNVKDQYRAGKNTNKSLLNHYNRFGIEIVLETYSRGNTFFPTEKTIRPLSSGKPILIYGPVGFLHHLQAMGFKTWHNVWDESYDRFEGVERWRQIKKTLYDIKNLDQEKVVNSCREICEHNLKLLNEIALRFRPQ